MKKLADGGKVLVSESNNLIQVLDPFTLLLLEGTQLGLTAKELYAVLSPERSNSYRSEADIEALQVQWHSAGFCPPKSPLIYQLRLQPARSVLRLMTCCEQVFQYFKCSFNDLLLDSVDSPKASDTAGVGRGNEAGASSESIVDSATLTEKQVKVWETINPKGFGVAVEGEPVEWFDHIDPALIAAAQAISDLACKEDDRLAVLHAAGLVRDKQMVLMPAEAGSGKTTLTAHLLDHGFRLVNDDILPVNPDLSISPIRYPMAIKSGSWETLEGRLPGLMDLTCIQRFNGVRLRYWPVPQGKRVEALEPCHPTHIIQPQFSDAGEPTVRRLSPTEALAAIIQAKPWFEHPLDPQIAMTVTEWLEELPAWRIQYRTSEQATAMIDSILSEV